MSDERNIGAAFNEGLGPVMEETPPAPEWESMQFESGAGPGGSNRWWVAAVAAVVVLLVGAGSFLLAGQIGGSDETGSGGADTPIDTGATSGSIEGRWVLESWQDGDTSIAVEVGVNTFEEAWIEFTADFVGERDTFISADGMGTAGTVSGFAGCNLFGGRYEYSGGFLILQQIEVNAAGCEPDTAERVMVPMLKLTSDGIEVIMGTDRMEFHGSNLEGQTYPLTFRRDGLPPPAATEAPSPTTTLAPEEGLAMRVYDVEGIEVVTPSLLSELPDRVTRVEFHTTVIDEGDGPVVCTGIVLDSLPPQCSGPPVTGLDMEGWSEEVNGVRWGERSVVVTWPPVDGAVELLDQGEYAPPDIGYPPGELPAVCEGIDLGAGAGPVNDYARSIGSSLGGLYVANDGSLVLQVVGDPEPHREALAELGGACVVEVVRSSAEQRAIQESLPPLLGLPALMGTFSSSTGAGGRVDLQVPVVDRATALEIAVLVDDPTAIRIIGMGVIHG